MKNLITIAIVCAATLAWAGTATKEYVDRRDSEVLAESKAYTDAHAGGDIPAYWALANVTNAQGGAVYATDIGALPVDGTAEHAIFADEAGVMQWPNIQSKPWWAESDDYALIANEANYSTDAGNVPWYGIQEKPDWIGNTKPTYTPQEIGAAPAKTTLILGGTSPNYELRLNGVAQTFDQVKGFLNAGEVVVRHLNGLYKPTYSSEAEIMFDCVGMISGKVETRRIHMIASGAVSFDPLKVLAEEAWVLGLSTTYTNLAGSAFVSLNQSVQTVTVDGAPVTISMPTAVQGGTRDFVVYVNNTSAATDAPLVLPAGTYYADDDTATNAFTKGTVSALYITEMSGAFMLGRKELKQIVVH